MSQTVLITGSSSGFGYLTAKTLAGKGYSVFASMRGVEGKNAETAGELRAWADAEGLALQVVELDVTDEGSIQAAVETIIETTGSIDVVVNNAGVGTFGMVEAFPIEEVRNLYDVNVFGMLRVNRTVLPHMRQQGTGLLIYVSSTVGRVLMPFWGIYASTKWAGEALAENYRYELSLLGIDSVIVQSGGYPTSFVLNMLLTPEKEVFDNYGPVTSIAQAFGAGLAESLKNMPSDPQEVADTILNLIETPVGERPLRTVVGMWTEGLPEINFAAAEAQKYMLNRLGMEQLLNVAS